MSTHTDTMEAAAADAVTAPLDLLLTETRRNGYGTRRAAADRGGRTTRPGWPSAAGRKQPLPMSWAAAGWRRCVPRREHTSMIADPEPPEPVAPPWSANGGERLRMLTVRGRILRVAVREGDPDRPPLLLCNGIGVSLELFQPFVDALEPRREVIRFDMPGVGGSPAPVIPYHLTT